MPPESSAPQVWMDCCRVAERLPVEALARELGLPPPRRRGALSLEGAALAAALREERVRGQAYLYANGCAVAVGMSPPDVQALLLWLAQHTPGADFEGMMVLREMRMAPATALSAQARALSSSVALDALERKADLLLDEAERVMPPARAFSPFFAFPFDRGARRQALLARVIAFRYECVHGQGMLDRQDARWDLRHQAAYRQMAADLQLAPRTALLSHKLDRLDGLLHRSREAGHSSGTFRQMWLEVWLLVLFPLGRLLAWVLSKKDGFIWMQRWLRQLHLFL